MLWNTQFKDCKQHLAKHLGVVLKQSVFLFKGTSQGHVQCIVILKLDYCISFMHSCMALQLIQNHPNYIWSWLLSVACTSLKTLMLTCIIKNAPTFTTSLCSIKWQAQFALTYKESMHPHFSVYWDPGGGRSDAMTIWTAQSLVVFKQRLKTSLFTKHLNEHQTYSRRQKKNTPPTSLFSYLYLLTTDVSYKFLTKLSS